LTRHLKNNGFHILTSPRFFWGVFKMQSSMMEYRHQSSCRSHQRPVEWGTLEEHATHLPCWPLLRDCMGVPGRTLHPCTDLETHTLDGRTCVEAPLKQKHQQQQQQEQVVGLEGRGDVSRPTSRAGPADAPHTFVFPLSTVPTSF
jgi:hypothetical protein